MTKFCNQTRVVSDKVRGCDSTRDVSRYAQDGETVRQKRLSAAGFEPATSYEQKTSFVAGCVELV